MAFLKCSYSGWHRNSQGGITSLINIISRIEMRNWLVLAILVLFGSSVLGGTGHTQTIEDHCEKIVGDSYSLLETCINSEIQAKEAVESMEVDPGIYNHCAKIVGDSWSLMRTCIRGEYEAINSVDWDSIDERILSYCKKIVGNSWSLMKTCVNSELRSKRALGR